MAAPINVGIIGLGNVGSGTLEILADNSERIGRKLGSPLVVRSICARSVETAPPAIAERFPDAQRTTDWRDVIADPEVDIVADC